jgi:phage terminase small subunit
MALTGKKRAFADAVLAGFSNKEAAIRAGYSAATASQAGARLVKDKDVAAHIAANKKQAPKGAGVPADPPPPPPRPTFDVSAALMHSDPRAFLLAAMNDGELDPKLRIDAAKALMPFTHNKLGEGGKKDQRQDAAKKAGAGKFGSAAPPTLAAANGKRV